MTALFLVPPLLAALIGLMALAGCSFAVAAGLLLGGYDRNGGEARRGPTVALLKPLYGDEPHLASNLSSFLTQTYQSATTLWMGVHSAEDAAVPAARRIAAANHAGVRLVVDPRRRGVNAKIANVMNLEEAASGAAIVVLTDSDIAAPPGWLSAVVEALERPGVGLVTCLYFGVAARASPAARLGAMGVSYGFLPQGAVGVAVGARPAMGSTLALRRDTLAALGGFAAVKDVLADDYELGRAIRRLGLEVATARVLVSHDSAEASLRELWLHELRWARTIRGLDPAGFAGSVVTHATPLALASLALSGGGAWAWWVLAAALVTRLWLKRRVDRVTGVQSGPWWLMPVRDMLSVAVFVAAWSAHRVDWRGSRFHVGRDGELTPV